jgi:prephenate dehydrogenase
MAVGEATPEKHDKMMAVIQALNHFNTITLGMALVRTNITPAEINKYSTPIFRTKLEIIKKVFTESPELYLDIITGNPQTEKMLDIYEQALKDIRTKIKFGSKTKSREAVNRAARKIYGSKNK